MPDTHWRSLGLNAFLDELEQRIVPEVEEELWAGWEAFSDGTFRGGIFRPRRSVASPPRLAWPIVGVNEAQDDADAMLMQQYAGCSAALAEAAGSPLNVRANYGTGILPSLFGAELFVMDAGSNTLQTTRPLAGPAAMRRVLEAGVPGPYAGLGARVMDVTRRFVSIGRRYPRIGRYVHVYHPDVQGPMDVCEMLWGSNLFLALHDDPQQVHDVLNLITRTYRAFMQAWRAETPVLRPGYAAHWGMVHRGSIMLRDDSAMNLSPAMFREFVEPYDQRLLDAFDGGAVHFCGRGDHFIDRIASMRGVHGVAMSQPHLNDMETVFRHTVDAGIPLLGLARETAEAALRRGRDLHARVHCRN